MNGLNEELNTGVSMEAADTTIDGKQYARMLYGGAALLSAHANEINDLNVFPVPDGDTGTNMAKTLEGGLSEIDANKDDSIGSLSNHFAHGILLGARGNSGVILSQIFSGISEELSKYDKVGAFELASAYRNGIKKSYSAVQNPTEGTILTVFRESTEYAATNINEHSTVEDFFRLHIEEAKRSLASTKEILPVLAEADVVDSGGAGYLYIALGMYEALTGKLPDITFKSSVDTTPKIDIDTFTRDSVLEFGYCTEFLLRLTTAKVDPDKFDMARIHEILDELHGESVVAYKTDDVVKVHVHTFSPGDILSRMQAFGEFLTVKIENMSVSHSETEKAKKKNSKKFEVLAVASGDGICALFSDLGADGIINGEQTANPSIEEFVKAFDECESEDIIVLPNNKNVILAANQAAEIYDKARIHVIKTRSLMEGFSALSVVSAGVDDIDALIESIQRAASGVVGSEITKAVRNVTLGGQSIKEGDYISITNGEITSVSDTANGAFLEFLKSQNAEDYELITVFTGTGVSPSQIDGITELIENEYPDLVLTLYESGQDVYDYMIALE